MNTITKHYIDGAFVESHGREVMEIINPTNRKVIAQVTLGDEDDARRAIAAAKRAFARYGRSTKEERAKILRRLHEAVSARIDDLTAAMVEEIGPTAHALQLDVTQEEQWRSAAAKIRDVGEVDIVVNNAGYFPNRSIDELDLATWRKTFATNLDSHFLSAKYFLPTMRKKKWGRFVGISSNMVGLAIPGMSHYIATKMGIIGFMRGLANDVANDGITANAVLPGLTNTLATAPQSEDQKRATWEQQAIKRMEEPEDVTGAVLFLTSDDAAFITGQAIVVDGGQYRIG